MTIPNQERIARFVGSDLAELLGRQLMLDVLDQMHDQPDRWVLVSTFPRRIKADRAQVPPAIAAVIARGWLEADTTFHGVRRVRLTAAGRALLGAAPRVHVPGPTARRRVLRRSLGSRPVQVFAGQAMKD